MKKIISILFGVLAITGCEPEPISLSAKLNNTNYLLSVNKTNASMTIGKSTKTVVVKSYGSKLIKLEDEDGKALNFVKQPKVSNWVCDLCVNHELPTTWE